MQASSEASARERAIVAEQLGRDPRGSIAVAALCPFGLPLAIRTTPRLDDGSPFPTLYYLTCPVAVRDAGRLEAAGRMRDWEARLRVEPDLAAAYREAHERYVAQRDALEPLGRDESAGGMPARIKCLHALYAHHASDANPIGELVAREIEPLDCPGPCVHEPEPGVFRRVPGHPGKR